MNNSLSDQHEKLGHTITAIFDPSADTETGFFKLLCRASRSVGNDVWSIP